MPAREMDPARLYRRRYFSILVSVVAFGLLLLAALPYAMSYGMHKWLQANAGGDVRIEDIDFNPFTGRAAIKNLQVDAGGETLLSVPRLDVDVEWMPLFSRQLLVKAVDIDGVQLAVVMSPQGSLRVGGIELPAGGEADVGETAEVVWGYGVDRLEIANSIVRYRQPDLSLDLQLDAVGLARMHTWVSEPAPFDFTGSVNGAAVRLDGELPPLSSGVGFRGTLSVRDARAGDFADLLRASVAGLDGRLGAELEVDAGISAAAGDLVVTVEGSIDLGGFSMQLPDERLELGQESLAWKGRAALSMPSGGPLVLDVGGKLEGLGLAVRLPSQGLAVSEDTFAWEGTLSLAGGEPVKISADGALNLGALNADSATEEEIIRFAQLGGLTLGSVRYAPSGEIVLSDLNVTDVVFARNPAGHDSEEDGGALLSAGSVHADTISLVAGMVDIGTLAWRDVTSVVVREQDGQWRAVRILDTLPFTGKEHGPKDARDDGQGGTRIGKLVVEGNSRILLEDNSVEPAFRLRMNVAAASLDALDTGKPQQRSPLTIRSNFGKHSRFDVDGWVKPFAEPPDMEIRSAIEGVALLPVSPYLVRMFGYGVDSGQLDASSSVSIDAGHLESDNQLTLRSLELVATDSESRERLDSVLAIPLDTALDMLRDSNNTIHLDLPVSGDLDDPSFDASHAISLALGNAVKTGSLTFLALGLQPYGTLITVARVVGEEAMRVRLQPVGFEAGSAKSMLDGVDYLDKVAGILKERPGLNIRVCGIAANEDREVLGAPAAGKDGKDAADAGADGRLLELATQRGDFVKDYLVEKYGAASARLVACQPRIADADEEGGPRVDLLI